MCHSLGPTSVLIDVRVFGTFARINGAPVIVVSVFNTLIASCKLALCRALFLAAASSVDGV